MARATQLFDAYVNNEVPHNGGFIVTAFFIPQTIYAIYEITAYKNVKDIYKSPEGLVFKTDGNRTHLMVEPPSYSQRFTEPVNREAGYSIPYRFSECTILTGKRQERIMIPEEPKALYSSFTILESKGENFAYIFFPSEDVYMAIRKFIADSLFNDCGIRKQIALDSSEKVLETIKKFNIWQIS